MRREFEMTPEQHERLLDACKPTPAMFLSGGQPMAGTPQENANSAWATLGAELGFDGSTARPVPGKGDRFFTAEVAEMKEIASWQRTDSSGKVVEVTVSVPTVEAPKPAVVAGVIAVAGQTIERLTPRAASNEPLRAIGVSRDAECKAAVMVSLNREPTDDELRALHEMIRRATAFVGIE